MSGQHTHHKHLLLLLLFFEFYASIQKLDRILVGVLLRNAIQRLMVYAVDVGNKVDDAVADELFYYDYVVKLRVEKHVTEEENVGDAYYARENDRVASPERQNGVNCDYVKQNERGILDCG